MIVLIATNATPHVPRGELHHSHMRTGIVLIIFSIVITLTIRPYVINVICVANHKPRFTQEKNFPREGEKFLSRARKSLP